MAYNKSKAKVDARNAAKNITAENITEKETEDFEKRVSKILVRLGFPSNIKGYYYIKKAIKKLRITLK